MDIQSKHEKELVLAQILYIYIIPILLLYYKILPGQFRIILLFGVALMLYGIVRHAKWTYADLEIRKNFMKDIIPYTIFTIVSIGVIVSVSKFASSPNSSNYYEWWEDVRFLLLFIPISVLQELIFRGVLMHMLRRAFTNVPFIIILNASLFALIHIIYLNAALVMPLTFIGGVGFAWMYYKYPNLILISISHTILNFVAMILGFFVLR